MPPFVSTKGVSYAIGVDLEINPGESRLSWAAKPVIMQSFKPLDNYVGQMHFCYLVNESDPEDLKFYQDSMQRYLVSHYDGKIWMLPRDQIDD